MLAQVAILLLALGVCWAELCSPDVCKIEDECVCSSHYSPIDTNETPKFITITIDDAVSDITYNEYLEKLLFTRTNPDDQPISATFYIPHEYTDYRRVNDLYNKGFEIADNSVTKNTAQYWEQATQEILTSEFRDQRDILSRFANVPKEHIRGARTPHFQIKNDLTFEAYQQAGIVYDGSWPARSGSKIFPFSLDFPTDQECIIGECPTKSFPKMWVSPINNILGKDDMDCNVLFGCQQNGTSQFLSDWITAEFKKHEAERIPFKLLINSALFQLVETSFDAVNMFLDNVSKDKDVFIVSEWQLLQWMKNPVPVSEYKTASDHKKTDCTKVTCELKRGDDVRYMTACGPCPRVYPWLGNPLGS